MLEWLPVRNLTRAASSRYRHAVGRPYFWASNVTRYRCDPRLGSSLDLDDDACEHSRLPVMSRAGDLGPIDIQDSQRG